MAGTARRDVASVCLRIRSVTAKTRDVRIQPRWDRETHATAVSTMASNTRGVSMLRMIESRIKTAQRWKSFDLAALDVCMTDRANRAGRICELLCMTARARRMVRFAR